MLKPSLLKLASTFVLFFAVDWLWRSTVGSLIMDTSYFGLPLRYFITWGPCQAGQNCSEFNGLYLGLDLVFWYIISAALVAKFWKK